MGIPGWGQIALVVLLLILLFGRGKISDLMGDVAKGIRSFKDGLKDEADSDDPKLASADDTSELSAPRTAEAERTT